MQSPFERQLTPIHYIRYKRMERVPRPILGVVASMRVEVGEENSETNKNNSLVYHGTAVGCGNLFICALTDM